MLYRWDDFSLDPEGLVLTRQGEQVEVSRKTLGCITHLIKNRHRVVGYDELIQVLWGHNNVTNHQLSQVIVAARRMLGDDGHTQRLIRTASGLGYRWVAPVQQGDDTVPAQASAAASVAQTSPAPEPEASCPPGPAQESPLEHRADPVPAPLPASAAPPATHRRPGPVLAIVAVIVIMIGAAYLGWSQRKTITTDATAAQPADPVDALRALLVAGRYEDVRDGLARLPPDLANMPTTKLLEVELDYHRGRVKLALQKLEKQQARADAADDPLWRARVLTLKSRLYAKEEKSGAEVAALAESALGLLESLGDAAPAEEVSRAYYARGSGRMREGRFDDAMRDYVRARDILVSIGDDIGAAQMRGSLARAWMRSGRLREALDELEMVLEISRRAGNTVDEIFTLNTISRIQVELLRWDDALASNDEALRLIREVPESDRRRRILLLRAFILTGKGRLREASAQLEEAMQLAPPDAAQSPMIEAMYHLEAGETEIAVKRLQEIFRSPPKSFDFNPMLEDAEGPLLAWTMAAEASKAHGEKLPPLPAAQRAMLENPKTSTGHIARGRWLLLQGQRQSAEMELRFALQETRRMGQTYRMTFAGEALIELLLQNGDVEAAQTLLDDLRGYHPIYVDRDYRTSLLALRVAIARGEPGNIRKTYQHARMLAGERALPEDVRKRYEQTVGSVTVQAPAAQVFAGTDRR